MSRRIGNTLAPRNPVARALATRGGGGAHQQNRSGQRRQSRAAVQSELDDWRDDLEFERSLNNNQPFGTSNSNRNEGGSGNEPSDRSLH